MWKPRSALRGWPVLPALVWLLLAGVTFLVWPGSATAAEPVRLTTDGRLKFSPIYVSEGREIVYVELERPELYRLKRRLTDGRIAPLHEKAPTSELDPAFSPDGALYAFCRNSAAAEVGLVIRDAASGAETLLAPTGGLCGYRSPAVAPDRSRVLFSFADGGRQQICSVTPQGAKREALTDSPGINIWPAWSPDAGEIAFSSSRDGNFEIYVMRADGSQPRRLTDSPRQDIRPTFSPDGRRLVFTSHRDGNAELYVMTRDGAVQTRLTNHPERDDYPAWHPDGDHLVWVAERDGEHDLYTLDAAPGSVGQAK